MHLIKLSFFFILLFTACSPQSNLQDDLQGKWHMAAVRIYEQDASPQLNPTGGRWISFQADGKFTSGEGDKQENAGTYTFKEADKSLHLDSDAGPGDDSNWQLIFRPDTLLMRGIGTERQQRSEVIMVR